MVIISEIKIENLSLESNVVTDKENRYKKFSYSKLNTYETCPWRYKLTYVDQHFIQDASLAADFGTLCHYIEEKIGNEFIQKQADLSAETLTPIDFEYYINLFIDGDNEQPGIKDLKSKYPEKFNLEDKYKQTFNDKANNYLNIGLYMLNDMLLKNSNIKVIGTEIPFEVEYENYIFHGFIDRLLFDSDSEAYIIQDLKTWASIDGHSLTTPLQFVFYVQAVQNMYNVSLEKIKCQYVLPLTGEAFDAGTSGFMKRGLNKINNLLSKIQDNNFAPNPSPLCYFCPFSATNPEQPADGKNLCPYHSNWTRNKRDFSVNFEWAGLDNHDKILEAYISNNTHVDKNSITTSFIKKDIDLDRFLMLKRW